MTRRGAIMRIRLIIIKENRTCSQELFNGLTICFHWIINAKS
jgi:hypothetical protein